MVVAGEWEALENGRRWRNLGPENPGAWRNVWAEKSRVEVKRVWKANRQLAH